MARPSKWGNSYVVERARSIERNEDFSFEPGTKIERKGPWTVYATGKRGWHTGPEWGGFGEDRNAAVEFAVLMHRRSLLAMLEGLDGPVDARYYLGPLLGHDLACWCAPGAPCHADTLIELANSDLVRAVVRHL